MLAFTRYLFTLKAFCALFNHSYSPPPSTVLPTLLQCYCTTVVQCTTPPTPPCGCHTPYTTQNWYWQYPVKAHRYEDTIRLVTSYRKDLHTKTHSIYSIAQTHTISMITRVDLLSSPFYIQAPILTTVFYAIKGFTSHALLGSLDR